MSTEIQEIIARILNGNSTETDRYMLNAWIGESEANRKELEKSEALWNAYAIIANTANFNPAEGYHKFLLKTSLKTKHPKTRKILNSFTLRIAASLLIAFSISFITYQVTKTVTTGTSYFELITPQGSHTQLTLTDGTKIWLNAGSKLRYPNRFDGKERIVFLEGEAYFNVKKDAAHPFIVKTSEVNVKALGTSFNVKAYPNEGTVETTLVNGIVLVERNNHEKQKSKPIKLVPNQKVTFLRTSGKVMLDQNDESKIKENNVTVQTLLQNKENAIVTTNVNTELYTSWKENKLLFENEAFESIANKLERRYGATIIFNNAGIKQYRFSGKFPEISIERALKALQYASPFQYEIKHDTIYINH